MIMPRKIFYFPVSEQERRETLESLCNMRDDMDVMHADMALGFAAQDRCSTRDELVAYAWNESLVPYLRYFLERRGWLDDDWERRIYQVTREFGREKH
jgi:hypothetical protein